MKYLVPNLFCCFLFSCATPLVITEKNRELYKIEVDQKVGYIDQKGNVSIQPKYEADDTDSWRMATSQSTDFFVSGTFAVVKKEGKYGLIDSKGNQVTPFIYDQLIKKRDSTFIAAGNNAYGMLNSSGDTIVPFLFDSRFFLDSKKSFPASINNQYIIYDPVDHEIIETNYDYISPFINGLARAEKNEEVVVINESGEHLLDTVYQEIGFFSSNLFPVKKNNEWRFMNKEGEDVFNQTFTKASEFWYGVAIVKKEKYGAIDTSGKVLIPFDYEFLRYEGKSFTGEDHFFMFCEQEDYYSDEVMCGLINQGQDTILAEKYADLFYFDDYVEATNGGKLKTGVIDLKKNKVIIPFAFKELNYDTYGLTLLIFSDEEGNEYMGYLNRRNKIVWSNNKQLLKQKLAKPKKRKDEKASLD